MVRDEKTKDGNPRFDGACLFLSAPQIVFFDIARGFAKPSFPLYG